MLFIYLHIASIAREVVPEAAVVLRDPALARPLPEAQVQPRDPGHVPGPDHLALLVRQVRHLEVLVISADFAVIRERVLKSVLLRPIPQDFILAD